MSTSSGLEGDSGSKPTIEPRPAQQRGLAAIFINPEGEFRSGWRALIFFGACLLAALFVNALLQGILAAVAPRLGANLYALPNPNGSPVLGWNVVQFDFGSFVDFFCAAIATAICAQALERRGFSSVGFKPHPGWARDLTIGLSGGTATLLLALVIEVFCGSFAVAGQHHGAKSEVLAFVTLLAGFALAAAFEELIFRGFAFQALVYNIGPAGALAISSVLFGVAHLTNPDANAISTLNTILAGLWLGAAYLKTRSLWLCTGLHLSWNFVMVFVFGLPVSGIGTFDQLGILIGKDKAPLWISGGSYGPEGGLAVAVAIVLSLILLWRTRLIRPSDEMLQAIAHGEPQPRYQGLSLNS